MASDAEKKKSIPNIVDASIEIVNTGIVQAKEVPGEEKDFYSLFCWDFLEQRENWLEPFNCSLKFAFKKNQGGQLITEKDQNNKYYRDCNIEFQSYDQACFCKVKIEVRRLKHEPKESVVHTFELASIGKMKEESSRIYYIPNKDRDIGEEFFEYRIEIVVKPFLMEKFESLKKGEKTIAIPNIEKPAGLKLNGTMCDFEIVCQNKKFSCHKAVLATNINHFEVPYYTFFHNYTGYTFSEAPILPSINPKLYKQFLAYS